MKKDRVMIALDFSDPNFLVAKRTLSEWAACAAEHRDLEIVFGVSTTAVEPMKMIREIAADLKPVSLFYWNNEIDRKAAQIAENCTAKSCAPFFSEFNYGSLVNRLLLLATVVDCEYLVRVDPGTCPFYPAEANFGQVILEHLDFIKDTTRVVSRGYKDRLSLRHSFVLNKEAQEKLVLDETGINAQNQVTGGALWTSTVPGIPAMPFEKFGNGQNDLTLVWGSDDAIYQVLAATAGSQMMPKVLVPRFDPDGMRKTTVAYYRGIVGMVYLWELIASGNTARSAEKAKRFLVELKANHLDPVRYRYEMDGNVVQGAGMETIDKNFTMENVAPTAFLEKISQGLENHQRLLVDGNWQKIASAIKDNLQVGHATT